MDSIELPKGQVPRRTRRDLRERSAALARLDPDSIFALKLDGQPLKLFELSGDRSP
jgi:hypothetical protein